MLLRRVKFKSNGSRNIIMQRNLMENIRVSNRVIKHNFYLGNHTRKLGNLFRSGHTTVPCKLNYVPKFNNLCAGTKTTGSTNRPMGVFYDKGSRMINTLVKSVNFFNYSGFNINLPLSYSRVRPGEYRYSHYLKYHTKVSSVFGYNYSILYRSSGGNYALYLGSFKNLKISIFRLPSGVKLKLPYWSLCLVGRTIGVFNKYRVFGSFKFGYQKKKKRFSTRGVAMNPVDHHNGGRSKSKTPFFNKYNKIAKMGK